MILDIRYHIFTITAIFAALGLGILIGTSLIGDETLLQEQKKLIKNIRTDLQSLKSENRELENNLALLETKLEYRKNMEKKILSLVLQDRVTGKKFFLYGMKAELTREIKELLHSAGAELKVIEDLPGYSWPDNNYRIILWNQNNADRLLEQLPPEPQEKTVVSDAPNVMELVLTLMESERDG